MNPETLKSHLQQKGKLKNWLGYHSHKLSKNWGHLLENTKHESRKSDCKMVLKRFHVMSTSNEIYSGKSGGFVKRGR